MKGEGKTNDPYVLIIDDDPEIRDMLGIIFQIDGVPVRSAKNGREGLQIITESRPPAVILLDLMMPVMNGFEFLEEIGKRNILAPIIVLTAADRALLDNPLLKRARGVIRKPFQVRELMDRVGSILHENPAVGVDAR